MGMLRACLLGAAVTFALIVVPVVHWITFWFAPFIGGYFAGSRTQAAGGRVFLVGLVMGLLLFAPVAGVVALASLMFFDLAVAWLAVAAGVLTLYVAAAGSLGAALGGASTRGQAPVVNPLP